MIRAQSIIQCTHTHRSQKSEVQPKRDSLCKIGRGDVSFPKKGDLRIQTNFFCKGRWGKVIEFANLKIQDRNLNCLKSCDSVS